MPTARAQGLSPSAPFATQPTTTRAQRNRATSKTSTSGPRPAVLYARVSTRVQEREGFSIPAQLDLLRKYAQDKGFRVQEEFIDVETARKAGRTAFARMLTHIRTHAARPPVVLAEKTDRLYRNIKDWVLLEEVGVEFHLVREGIVYSEASRSSEKFIHGIKVLMAKNYVENLAEEVKKGVLQKCKEGGYPGRAPIGYINRRDGGRAHLEVDPSCARLVQRLFELYDTGNHSIDDLSRYAKESGLRGKRGGTFSPSVVHGILRNPLYAGRFTWGGEEYESTEPQILPWELYQRVQDRMNGYQYTRPRTLEFAFTGLVKCGWCGAAITAELRKERYIYYHCARRCRRESFTPEPRMRELLAAHVRRLKLPADVVEAYLACLGASREQVEADQRARAQTARARLDQIQRMMHVAYEDKLAGRIDDNFFDAKRAEWAKQRADAEADLSCASQMDPRNLETGAQLLKLANRAYDLFITREPMEQRSLVDVLFANCTLAEGHLTVTWRKPFDILAESARESQMKNGDSRDENRRRSVWWAILDSNQ